MPGAEARAWCNATRKPERTPDRRVRADRDGRFRIEHLGKGDSGVQGMQNGPAGPGELRGVRGLRLRPTATPTQSDRAWSVASPKTSV